MPTNEEREAMNAYVASMEGKEIPRGEATVAPAEAPVAPQPAATVTPVPSKKKGMTTAEAAHAARVAGMHRNLDEAAGSDGLKYNDNLGYLNIPVDTLPTMGLYYPQGTRIFIRAARGEEIKHWSTMNDQDTAQLSQVDDILNYIIERCVSVKVPGDIPGSWRDLKDIDRFYLLLAIREFTFLDGDNELMVPVSEGKNIPVTKEMIDFITIPEEIMKHYSPEERCFVFKLKTGREIRMHIPSLGATAWLKNYAQAKNMAREGFDTDFILYAPMLIADFRGLSQRAYEEMVADSQMWTVQEWSLIGHVRDTLAAAAEPKIKYQDENGQEVTIPLTFRGGIKALFTIQDPLSILC